MIGHFLKVMTRDVKSPVGINFDMLGFNFTLFLKVINRGSYSFFFKFQFSNNWTTIHKKLKNKIFFEKLRQKFSTTIDVNLHTHACSLALFGYITDQWSVTLNLFRGYRKVVKGI